MKYQVVIVAIVACAMLVAAVPLTAQEKADAVAEHNRYRCNVSPRAASMPRMVWDAGLEAVAQAFANTCPGDHNPDRTRMYNAQTGSSDYVGENLAWGYGSIVSAVQGFGNENRYYTYASNGCAAGQMCGHYTQVVWAGSVRVGCAKPAGTCSSWGDRVYVCNYAPGGNYAGERPYTSTTSNTITDACSAVGGTGATNPPSTTTTTTTRATTTTTTTRVTTTTTTTRATTTTTTTKATSVTTKATTTTTTTKAGTTTTKAASAVCPSSGVANNLRCRKGGAMCSVVTGGWGCCATLSGRMACPPEKPVLCASKACSGDYCCDYTANNCNGYGGPLTTCPTRL